MLQELRCREFLAASSAGPHGFVARVVFECEQQATDPRMSFARALLAVCAAALMLSTSACAGDPKIKLIVRWLHEVGHRRAMKPT